MDSSSVLSEKVLLQKIANGDTEAFSSLYYLWQPRLSSFIFSITKSKELTDEIVQDVFLKIWMTRESLADISSFKAYLFAICRNQSINVVKQVMKEYKIVEQIKKETFEIYDELPDEVMEKKLSLIDESINRLPHRQKEIFLLQRYERLTYDQISTKLGISRETVKTNLQLATKSISAYLQNKMVLLSVLIQFFSDQN